MKLGVRMGALLVVVSLASSAGCTSSGSSPAASAASSSAITVTSAWARPSIGMADAMAAYMVIANGGSAPDALIGAASDVAATVQMHETVAVGASPGDSAAMAGGSPAAGGMMAMQPVSRIELPAGATVELKSGGYHIMLTGLKEQLKAGDSFTLTLTFEKAGPLPVTVTLRAS